MSILSRIPVLLAICMFFGGPTLALFSAGALMSDDYLVSAELDPALRILAMAGFVSGIVLNVVSLPSLRNRRLFAVLACSGISHALGLM